MFAVHSIWLFTAVPWFHAFPVCYSGTFWMFLRWFQLPLLLMMLLLHSTWALFLFMVFKFQNILGFIIIIIITILQLVACFRFTYAPRLRVRTVSGFPRVVQTIDRIARAKTCLFSVRNWPDYPVIRTTKGLVYLLFSHIILFWNLEPIYIPQWRNYNKNWRNMQSCIYAISVSCSVPVSNSDRVPCHFEFFRVVFLSFSNRIPQ